MSGLPPGGREEEVGGEKRSFGPHLSATGLLAPSSRVRPGLLAGLAACSLLLHTPVVPGNDLAAYRAAGRLWLEGRAAEVYELASIREAHAAVGGQHRVGGYLASPLWLPLCGVLARLPEDAAQTVLRLSLVLAYAVGLGCLLRTLQSPGWELAAAAAFALAHPARAGLAFGNWAGWLFALLGLATWGLIRNRPWAVAVGWGLAAHLKPWALLGALALLRSGGFGGWLARTSLVGVASAAAALVWTGVGPWLAWIEALTAFSERGVTPFYNKVSLAAAAARFLVDPRSWLAPREPVLEGLTQALLGIGCFILLLLGLLRRGEPTDRWSLGLTVSLLAVPQVWDHGYLLLFLVVPALAARARAVVLLLFGASWFYPYGASRLLEATLERGLPSWVGAAYLALYPAFGLAALGALGLLSRERQRGSGRVEG